MKNKFTENGKDYLEKIVRESSSLSKVLEHFNYNKSGAGYNVLINTLIDYDINYKEYFTENEKKIDFIKKPIETYLTENSKTDNYTIKKRLFQENIFENKCCECGLEPIWNNKKLVLHLDHINGVNNDNRLENLRILCPNCHSQTDTFCGKHKKGNNCVDCGIRILFDSVRCEKCSKLFKKENSVENFQIDPNELQTLLWELPMIKIAKKYGCSDKTIASKIEKYGLKKPDKGYFTKKNNNFIIDKI